MFSYIKFDHIRTLNNNENDETKERKIQTFKRIASSNRWLVFREVLNVMIK